MFYNQNLKSNTINFLFFLFLFFIFNNFTVIELFKIKIELSDIIFIFLFLIFFIHFNKLIFEKFSIIDFILLLWPVLNILAFFFQDNDYRNFEGILFSFYCYGIYIFSKNYLKINFKLFNNILFIVILFTSILSITGWILAQLNYETILVKFYEDYPLSILKDFRSSGLTPSPNFLYFHLALGYLIIYPKIFENYKLDNKQSLLINCIICFGILFTFSKSILIFIFLFSYILIYKKYLNFNIKKFFILGILIFLIYNFFTNFILTFNKFSPFNKIENSIETNNLYVAENNKKPFYENNYFKIYSSIYFSLKKKSLKILKENYLTGIGNGNFEKLLKKEYPNLIGAKPHSTIISIILLTGIFGFLFWIFVFLSICTTIWQQKKINLIFIVYFIFIESVNMDIQYFKFIWLILPLILNKEKKLN